MLKKDGLCLIAVPDLRGYSKYYYGPFNCFDLEHVNHFDFETLSLALEKNHLAPQKVLESHRLVNEALAYPEVLILAKKTKTQTKKAHKTIRQPRKKVLLAYIRKSKQDLKKSFKFVTNNFKFFNNKTALYGIYGLSSSAFRFLKIAKKEFGNIKFDWFADSDNRLNKKRIFEIPILNKKEFIKYAETNQSKTIIAFIVAVNAHRIVQMLKKYKLNNLKILQVPPRCKNRL
jgi:FlaA1/EpsC-like NDP-sugar epimerase